MGKIYKLPERPMRRLSTSASFLEYINVEKESQIHKAVFDLVIDEVKKNINQINVSDEKYSAVVEEICQRVLGSVHWHISTLARQKEL